MSETTGGVYAAFAKALQSAKFVGKDGWNDQQKFKFRGIDGVLQAVGPAFRENDLFLVPEVVTHHIEQIQSARGKPMVQVILHMKYTVTHKDGSSFNGTAVGEATDFADKATSKAGSVALRTFLLQSMVLPTGDSDPDEEYNERGNQPRQEVPAKLYADETWNPEQATRQQLAVAIRQAQQDGENEVAANLMAVGKRRFAPQQQANDGEGADQ